MFCRGTKHGRISVDWRSTFPERRMISSEFLPAGIFCAADAKIMDEDASMRFCSARSILFLRRSWYMEFEQKSGLIPERTYVIKNSLFESTQSYARNLVGVRTLAWAMG